MEVIHVLQSVASPALDRLMLLLTELGSEQAYIVLLLIAYIGVDAGSGRRLAVYFLAGFYLNEQLKALFHTPRPFTIEPGIVRSPAALATAQGNGFPSGHAQSSTTFWGLAAIYGRRAWLTVVAVALVTLVSISRLYLGVHLPVDILGGILVGLAVVSAAAAVDRLRLRAAPKQRAARWAGPSARRPPVAPDAGLGGDDGRPGRLRDRSGALPAQHPRTLAGAPGSDGPGCRTGVRRAARQRSAAR